MHGFRHQHRTSRVFALVLGLVLTAGACTSSSPQAADPGQVSVKSFGAKGDGQTDDAAAFQAALDAVPPTGRTLFVPAGTYRIGTELVVRQNGLRLRGEGPQSVLKLADGVRTNMFVMPAPFLETSPDVVVSDVEISRLTLDGNKNGNPYEPPTMLGIHIIHAERVTLSELTMKDWPYDAISVGVGQRPNVDVTIRNSRFVGIGRNGIHLGYGRNLRISQVFTEDTPSQQWGAAAGNGVDVEVEGVDSFVDGVVVEDSIFQRMDTRTAGYGVALQPAYGPVRNAVVRRNLIRNHQMGVFVAQSTDVTVEDNWVVADSNLATGAGIVVQEMGAVVSNNVLNLLRWPSDFGHAGVMVLDAPAPAEVTGNRVYGGLCTVRARLAGAQLSITDNVWGNAGGCFLDPAAPLRGVTQADNERLPVDALDDVPPTLRLDLRDGATVESSTKVKVDATDEGEGVARIFLLVDGIPVGVSDRPPHELTLDPAELSEGDHRIEAIAVDNAANASDVASVTFKVSR